MYENSTPEIGEIKETFKVLLATGSVAELRVPNTTHRTVSGYFKNFDKLTEAAYKANGTAPGIYVTLNPVRPDLFARAADHTIGYAKSTTSDSDILNRRWFPIDFDPVRPTGISSTNAEHEAALERAQRCREFLAQLGWPAPVVADSGNGAHLLYRVDLPNDPLTTDVLKQCMAALSLHFTDDRVEVDLTTYNAARIWKIYGTLAAKGDSTPERPHRFAKIIDAPADMVNVTPELLATLAGMNPGQLEAGATGKPNSCFDLRSWIEANEVPVVREGDWQDGRKWILNPCPWNEEHTNESAYIVQFANGAIAAGCHHNSCSEENWHTLKRLYSAGDVSVCELETTSTHDGRKVSPAERLMRFAEAGEFFHTSSGGTYVTVPVNGHYETWATNSAQLRDWLSHRYYEETRSVPSLAVLNQAISLCDAKARFDGEELRVFTRIAEANGKIYLDLADASWNVIEIDAAGWRVTSNPSVKFQRPRGLQPLPVPVSGGSIDELRRFINVANESDWILLVAWLLAALWSSGPYPILVLHGEQGSAKSTTARMLRSLIDPNTADLRSGPRDVRDVMLAANNGWIVSLDNLSSLPVWLSDALCRLSTGGGFSTRQLYTDSDETLIQVQRPTILNGIEELACRGDLLDRSLILYLPTIPDSARRSERDLWSDFEKLKPRILGALLTAVSGAMARLPNTKLDEMPRLADFALLATAAEHSLGWSAGAFLQAYNGNRTSANDLALEASPVAPLIRQLSVKGFEGTATELLNELNDSVDDTTRRQRDWPTSGQKLSNCLRRLNPNLDKIGVLVERRKESSRRIITISQTKVSSDGLSCRREHEPIETIGSELMPRALAIPIQEVASM